MRTRRHKPHLRTKRESKASSVSSIAPRLLGDPPRRRATRLTLIVLSPPAVASLHSTESSPVDVPGAGVDADAVPVCCASAGASWLVLASADCLV